MHPEMTPGAIRALQAAARWATWLQGGQIGPRELFLGLIDEEEGRPAFWLNQFGVKTADLRTRLASVGEPLPPEVESPLDPFSQTLVHQLLPIARLVALQAEGGSTVSTEHLLLAVLQQDEELRTLVESGGFQTAALEEQLLGVQGAPLYLEEPLRLSEPTELMEAARVLDANANRAREALRVVEDYCRLVLEDVYLSKECKTLRHELSQVLIEPGGSFLITARDTQGDIGTSISTSSERQRSSLRAVVVANCKRLQESLRTLEEYGKLYQPELGKQMESLRYRAYTLEKALLALATARQRLGDTRLYLLLTGATTTAALDWTIQEAVAGGVQVVQLREKNKSDADLIARARELRAVTRRLGVLFIINDRPDIARLVQADGVHLGQDDLPVADARRIVGPDALIGVSTHSPAQVEKALRDGASYIGVGPTFPGPTKTFDHYPGLEFIRWVAANTSLPAFAIGGITAANVAQVAQAGLRRVAVSHAIAQDDDPRRAALELRNALEL